MSYPITIDQILDATNRGLDIFMELFDIKDVRHNFKIRGEKKSRPFATGIFFAKKIVIRRPRRDFVRPCGRKHARTAAPLQKESRGAPQAATATTRRAA